MTTFNEPQMLMRYKNGELRMVTYKDIVAGQTVTFRNENWNNEEVTVTEVKEKRPSMGEFGEHPRPTSYRLAVL